MYVEVTLGITFEETSQITFLYSEKSIFLH